MKYRKHMKLALMYEIGPRWSSSDSLNLLENPMLYWMDTYFMLENYLVIDNKPVLCCSIPSVWRWNVLTV
ncbi:MAG: hypothetical protein IJX80_00525 [Clostridia bacterium]|nr:hypothetical protein [Clostridia bacterium]